MAQPYREPVDDAHTDKEFPENLDAEKQNAEIVPAYEEPFGDEEYAEIKYRTLRWW